MIDNDRTPSSDRASRAVAVLLLCLLATGCVKLAKSLVNVSRLQAAIIREFGEKNVRVNLNDTTDLNIGFINSPLNAGSMEERAKRASQTAVFVASHYPSIAEIEVIWVSFMKEKARLIVMNDVEVVDVFGFNGDGIPFASPTGPAPSAANDSLLPTAVYSPASDQTEITITGMQLQGNTNQGLSVSLRCRVAGDVTGVRRSSSPPQSVSFDFGSYSEKSLFPGAPKIKFVADRKVVFETSEQFSTSKNPDGLFSEFLNLQVPYSAFRRLTAGKKLTFVLGDYEYNLTDEQAEAMRLMTEYVKD